MAGEANDAVSGPSRVKMKDDPRLPMLPETDCPAFLMTLPRSRRASNWNKMDDQMVPLESILHGHLVAGLLWKHKLECLLAQETEKRSNVGDAKTNMESTNYPCQFALITSKWWVAEKA